MKDLSALKKGAAFIASMALICAGFAVFTHKDAGIDAAYADDVIYLTDNPDAPDVYMTTEITPEALVKIYDRLGFEPEGNVAVKMSTGEPPNSNYLRPELIGDLVKKVDGTIVECNTAYGGSRASTAAHEQVIKDHGLDTISKDGFVDIMDSDGTSLTDDRAYIEIPVPAPKSGTSRITQDYVGAHLANYDSLISLAHFKGHAMAGFGGAIKNMSIGIAAPTGKCWIHSGGTSRTNPWSSGPTFQEAMADATSAVSDFFDGKVVYINVMNRLSIDCDCNGRPSEPDIHDIGILASYDPVALDQACLDLIQQADNNTRFLNRVNSQGGYHSLEHGAEIGLGSREYNIVDIDNEETPTEIPTAPPTAEPTPTATPTAEPTPVPTPRQQATMTYADGALTISDLVGDAKLIHASYTNGALSGVEITDAANGTTNIPTRSGDKFMLWSAIGEMIPISSAITVETGTVTEPETTPTPTPEPEKSKTIVVYFSATNTTEGVAQKISDYTGADMFELRPANPYTDADLNWNDRNSRVNAEHNDPDRHVELETIDVPDWDSYDTVYIGAPIWWQEFSWVIDDFVKNVDFTGKTVVPFCTSMSSSLGQSAQHLAAKSSSGNWLDGMRFGTSATETQVRNWIDSLNLD